MNESDIYTSYRRTLKHLKDTSGGRDSRASARKQEARQRTADKHGLPISAVKQIVRDFDEANGIVHDHPQAYLDRLERDRLAAQMYETFSEDDVCAGCRRNDPEMRAHLLQMNGGPAERLDDVRMLRVVFDGQTPRWTCMLCTPFFQ